MKILFLFVLDLGVSSWQLAVSSYRFTFKVKVAAKLHWLNANGSLLIAPLTNFDPRRTTRAGQMSNARFVLATGYW